MNKETFDTIFGRGISDFMDSLYGRKQHSRFSEGSQEENGSAEEDPIPVVIATYVSRPSGDRERKRWADQLLIRGEGELPAGLDKHIRNKAQRFDRGFVKNEETGAQYRWAFTLSGETEEIPLEGKGFLRRDRPVIEVKDMSEMSQEAFQELARTTFPWYVAY